MSIETVPETWPDTEEHVRKVAIAANLMMGGNSNAVCTCDLTPDATETVLTIPSVDQLFKFQLTALSESASRATGVWAEAGRGTVTIHHDATAETDRKFSVFYVR